MTIYARPEMFIDTTPTFAQNIAGSLGTLAGQGLSSYLKNKQLRDLQLQQQTDRRQQQDFLASQLQERGLPPQIAYLPKDLQNIYFKQILDQQTQDKLEQDFSLGGENRRYTTEELQRLALRDPQRARVIAQQYQAEDDLSTELKKIESNRENAIIQADARKEAAIIQANGRKDAAIAKAESDKEIEQIKAENAQELERIKADNAKEKEKIKSDFRQQENEKKYQYKKEIEEFKIQESAKKDAIEAEQKQQEEQRIRAALEEKGITGALQDIFVYGTEGGRTSIIGNITDQEQRNSYQPISDQATPTNLDELVLSYERDNFAGLKGNEIAGKRRDIAKANTAYFKTELRENRILNEQSRDIRTLRNLNKSKDLVKWYDRLNIDSEGRLRLPFLGSKNAQTYVKALNRFYDGLKGTFGARITNLDVTLYGQRLPTLANSAEARELILNQMDLVNQINQIYYGTLRNLYGKYKDRLNEAQIEELAEKTVKDQIAPLEAQYQALTEQIDTIAENEANSVQDTFDQLPDASTEKGNILEDETTGERYQSDGTKWNKI